MLKKKKPRKQKSTGSKFEVGITPSLSTEKLDAISSTKVTNIDEIRNRALRNSYFSFADLDTDIRKLFLYGLLRRCRSYDSYLYLFHLYTLYKNAVHSSKAEEGFTETKQRDMVELFQTDIQNRFSVSKWPLIPVDSRSYLPIQRYEPQPQSAAAQIFSKVSTSVKPVPCNKDCCCKQAPHDLGSFSLEKGSWVSNCPNRRNRVECNCAEGACNNSSSAKSKEKTVGVDVLETICWGLDIYTRKNIFFILPENTKDEAKY